MKILVFGAGGAQQGHLIGEATKKGADVIAATHSEKNFKKLKEAGATPVLADMADADAMLKITKGVQAIAFLVPVALADPKLGLQYAKNVIEAAKANGVSKIVWNASGWIVPAKIGIPDEDVKVDIKTCIKESGLDYAIIEPTIYMENLLGPYCAPLVKSERKLSYPTPEDMPIGWIASRDVCAFEVAAIYNPDVRTDSFRVSGLANMTGKQLAEAFSKELQEDISYHTIAPKAFGKIMQPVIGEAGAAGVEAMYQGLHDAKEYPEKFNKDMQDVLGKLPVQMTSINEWIKEHKDNFI